MIKQTVAVFSIRHLRGVARLNSKCKPNNVREHRSRMGGKSGRGHCPPPRVKDFLKNRGEINASGDDLKTKHDETSGVDLVITL